MGNYWYANGNFDEAITCWEHSSRLDPGFPTVFRNLALAYYNKVQDSKRALTAMETAFALDGADARLLMELDLLHKLCNYEPWERLRLLESLPELVDQRNDLYLERLTLYNQLGDFETAKALINARHFQPWEGGEGKIVLQFCTANVELAKQAIENGDPARAIALLNELDVYPDNLGEGKLPGKPENDISYWKGIAYELLHDAAAARAAFDQAKQGNITPTQAIFYNDPQPDNIFYQAKAWQKTGNEKYARAIFENMLVFAKEHLHDKIRIDYFAVSLPELMVFDQDLDEKNHIHCLYIMGLAYLGHYEKALAQECFDKILAKDSNHIGAIVHKHCNLL
ncbi:MAG: tetratricopeptide repeat protein [Sphingobacteriales bacterium]|nr:MAG: tetratricopeptide repeat protein [Sphingobacteriales bacterium]